MAKKWIWAFSPHSGGTRIPLNIREDTQKRIFLHAQKLGLSPRYRLAIRFKSQFCYIDAYENDNKLPTHLCRIRYFSGRDEWSLAFYTYSNEKYIPCTFPSGQMCGTVEEALEVGMVYLA